MRVLILGASGMLGQALYNELDPHFNVLGVGRRSCDLKNYIKTDLLNLNGLIKTVSEFSPDVIVNCAAMVNLQQCSEEYQAAFALHYLLPSLLSTLGVYNILISTDSVFNGKDGGYKEGSDVEPLNSYAYTKLLGEGPIVDSSGLVLRTNIYGFNQGVIGNSLFEWGGEKLVSGEVISGFTNFYFNPVSIWQLSRAIKTILLHRPRLTGIMNVGSDRFLSKYEFLRDLAGVLDADTANVTPFEFDCSGSTVVRPMNTTLNIERLEKVLDEAPSFSKGLSEAVEIYKNRRG